MSDISKPLILSPGFFLVPEFSATGGVKYSRGQASETQEGERLEAEFSTKKVVDHVGLLKWSRKLVNLAYNAMERYASSTPIGYFCAQENYGKLKDELLAIGAEADSFNRAAMNVGSGRRVRISIFPIALQESDETAAVRLAQTVRERLTALGEALRAGDLDAYSTAWKRAKNLPRLATGIQAESVVFALEAAKEARAAVAAAIRGSDSASPMTPEQAGQTVNLDALDSAICLFTDSVNGSLAQVTDANAG